MELREGDPERFLSQEPHKVLCSVLAEDPSLVVREAETPLMCGGIAMVETSTAGKGRDPGWGEGSTSWCNIQNTVGGKVIIRKLELEAIVEWF